MKLIVGVTCMAVVGYVLHNVQQQMDESVEVIAQLEQEVVSANEKADQAVERNKATQKRLKKADAQIENLKREKEEIIEAGNITAGPETIETPTPTPEPTIVAAPDRAITVEGDEFSDGYCYRHDHIGIFQTAPGSSWDLIMRIQPADAGTTGQDTTNLYTIQIEDRVPGAYGINLWGGLGSFADDHCTLNITDMMHYIDAGSTLEIVQTGETGVIRHDGDDKYWDDHSESLTIRPFIWSN